MISSYLFWKAPAVRIRVMVGPGVGERRVAGFIRVCVACGKHAPSLLGFRLMRSTSASLPGHAHIKYIGASSGVARQVVWCILASGHCCHTQLALTENVVVHVVLHSNIRTGVEKGFDGGSGAVPSGKSKRCVPANDGGLSAHLMPALASVVFNPGEKLIGTERSHASQFGVGRER